MKDKKTANNFLKEKGIIKEGYSKWICKFEDGSEFNIGDLIEEFASQGKDENERLKTELAEVKRLLQELYSPTQRYSDRVVPGYWRQRLERFVK